MNTQPVGLPEDDAPQAAKPSMLLPLLITTGLCVLTSWGTTQYLAKQFAYQKALGEPLYAHIYAPWEWVVWAHKYYDNAKAAFNFAYLFMAVALGFSFLCYAMYFVLVNRRTSSIKHLHGSAHWATESEIRNTGLLAKKRTPGAGVYVGGWRDTSGKVHYLRHNGPEHVLCFAPTRSGKGVGLILPTLLSWPASAVVFDLKGENHALTAGWRKQAGHMVLVFDATDLTGRGIGYNPLQELRLRTEHEVADAQNIVQQIVDPDGKGLESHWDKTSFAFLVGVVLYATYFHTERRASLSDVAAILSSETGIDALYAHMKDNHFGPSAAAHPMIARAAIDMLEKEPRERGSVLSTAKSFFSLYADPVVSRNIAHSGFRISDLMNSEQPVTLYIIADPENKARLKPLIRLLLTQIVRNLTPRMTFKDGEALKTYKHRLLLMLDEFPSLGRMPIFEDALAHIGGYGIKAYIITQDLSQLQAAYGKDESILSNCHVRIAYAPNKVETAELLSKMTGTGTIVKRQVSTSGQRASALLGHVSESEQEHSRPLLTPDECMRLPGARKSVDGRILEAGDMLVFVAGFSPIFGRQILFFRDPTFSARAKIAPPDISDRLC